MYSWPILFQFSGNEAFTNVNEMLKRCFQKTEFENLHCVMY